MSRFRFLDEFLRTSKFRDGNYLTGEFVEGLDGNDSITLTSGSGAYTSWALGGYGADTITGTAGGDSIEGGFGNDVISGGDGDDELYGNQGDDTLYGQNGTSDVCNGGPNSDYCPVVGGGCETHPQCESW